MPYSEWGNDNVLWEAFQSGDQMAFKEIYFRYYTSLFAFGASMLCSGEIAEDCLHDFFIHIWKKRNNVYPKSSLQAFLYKSFKNYCLDYMRKQRTIDKGNLQYMMLQSAISLPIESAILEDESRRQRQGVVLELINQLSPLQKEALLLRFYHQMKIEDIAHVMETTYAAAAKHLSRAIKILQKKQHHLKKMYLLLGLFLFN